MSLSVTESRQQNLSQGSLLPGRALALCGKPPGQHKGRCVAPMAWSVMSARCDSTAQG